MSVKTAGVGHFQIPTAPAAGTSVTSGAANAYSTSAVQLIASTAAALYITGIYAEEAAASAATYKSVQLMIGAAGAETVIGQYLIAPSTGSTVTRTYRPIFPPIPVASGVRISAKTADSVGALATLVSLEVIAQTNVVDDGIPVGSVAGAVGSVTAGVTLANGAHGGAAATLTLGGAGGLTATHTGNTTGSVGSVTGNVGGNVVGSVGSVTGLTAANLDVAVSTRLATAGYTAPDNTRPANFAALAITAGGAVTAGTVSDKTGYALTAAYDPAKTAASSVDYTAARAAKLDNVDVAVSTRLASASYTAPDNAGIAANSAGVTTLTGRLTATRAANLDNLDAAVSTRLASGGYTAPDNASVAAIKLKTDNLPPDPADASDIAAAFGVVNGNVNAVGAAVTAVQTDVTAVKAKTSLLTFNGSNILASLEAIRGSALTGVAPGPFGV